MNQKPKRLLQFSVAAMVAYLLGFLVLWWGGGYAASRSGVTRDPYFSTGYPLLDTAEWQPLLGNCQPEYQWPGSNHDWSGGTRSPRCDVIGWAYYPLWLLVKSKHPTYALFDKDALPFETIDPRKLPNEFPFHPIRGAALKEAFARILAKKPDNPDKEKSGSSE